MLFELSRWGFLEVLSVTYCLYCTVLYCTIPYCMTHLLSKFLMDEIWSIFSWVPSSEKECHAKFLIFWGLGLILGKVLGKKVCWYPSASIEYSHLTWLSRSNPNSDPLGNVEFLYNIIYYIYKADQDSHSPASLWHRQKLATLNLWQDLQRSDSINLKQQLHFIQCKYKMYSSVLVTVLISDVSEFQKSGWYCKFWTTNGNDI